MVQSINTKALLTLASVIRRPYLISPHATAKSISEINFSALREHCGIKAVVFDKDNTLTAPYENVIHPNAQVGYDNALRVFGREGVAILSNSAGTKDDRDYKDAIEIEAKLGISVVRHDEKKPGGLQELLAHFDDSTNTSDKSSNSTLKPHQVCMVGDRLLTDIVFGNLYGMLTVHVLPLCSGDENRKDNSVASIIRSGENKFLYGDWFGGRKILSKTLAHKTWSGPHTCSLLLDEEKEQ